LTRPTHRTGTHRAAPFVAIAMTTPTIASALGIDGGPIFQIMASENLGLDARAIGVGFGLGVLSIPVQLWAARMPLTRARRNLRLLFALYAAQLFVLALLVAFTARGERWALIALVVTVAGEINLSVLYAPSWQPMLAYSLGTEARQRINSRARAAGGGLAAILLVVFGALGEGPRIAMLALIGAVAMTLAFALRTVSAPAPAPAPTNGEARPDRPPLPAVMPRIFLALSMLAFGAWPVFLLYVNEVLWPSANLGLVGAVQIAGALGASALWRATSADVTGRARVGVLVSAAAVAALATIRPPADGLIEQAVLVVAFGVAAAATSTAMMAMMELTHRVIDHDTAVRAMTIYDVIGSSSMQLGLLVGGVLVSFSVARADWALDPYRIYLAALAGLTIVVMHYLPRHDDDRS